MQKQIVEISFLSVFKIVAVLLLFVFLFLIKSILVVLFLSLIVASAINPVVNFFEKRKIPRVLGTLIVYIVAFLFFAVLLYFVIPPVVDEIRQFASFVPTYFETVSNQFEAFFLKDQSDLAKTLQDFLINFGDKIKGFSANLFGFVQSVFGGFATFALVIIISFYLAVQEKGVENFIRLITPKSNEDYVVDLWKRVEKKLGLWLQGQILLGLIIGAVVFVSLSLINAPYALLLGIVAGVFELIPVVGPIFSAILGVVLASLIDIKLALIVLIIYIAIQQIENNILVPMLMKKITGLNPIVVIVALLVGWELGGVLGMIISIPLATIFSELLDDYAKLKAENKLSSH